MHFPYITYGMMLYINTTVYRQNTYIEKMYVIYPSDRSERALKFFAFSHSNTAISLNILLVYFRYFVSEKYLISGVNILHTYTINAVSFYYSWYGAI